MSNSGYMTNGGGSVQINFGVGHVLSEDEAGWLCVKVLPYNSDQINSITCRVGVDVPTFMEWFNAHTDWDAHSNPCIFT